MIDGVVARLSGLALRKTVAIGTALLTLAVIVASRTFVGTIITPFGEVSFGHTWLTEVTIAILVAAPTISILLRATFRIRNEKRQLILRDRLLSVAQEYAKQGDWEFDVATQAFSMSDTLHRLLGDPEKTLRMTSATLMEMVNPEDRAKVAAALERVIERGSPEQIEFRIMALDGEERTHWVTGARLLGRDGKAVKVFGTTQDITERRAAETALRKSEDYYRHAVELSPQLPWVADPEGRTLELPAKWAEMTGITPEVGLGFGWTQALHPDDLGATLRAWDEPRKSGAPYFSEHRVRMLDGTYRWFCSRASARRDDSGNIICWYGSVEDIQDRKAAEIALRASEAALRETEDHYRHTVELSPQMPWTADPAGNMLEVYSKWRNLTGLSHEEVLGAGWSKALHPSDRDTTLGAWNEALRSGNPYDVEQRLRLSDGSYRWFRARATARRDSQGNIVRWYGTVEDIHDRKTAELALQNSEAFASSILEASADCIDVMDLDGRLLFMNSSCRRLMTAYGFDVVEGQDWSDLWPDDLKPKVLEATELAKSGVATRFNCFGLTAVGEMGHWDVMVSPILGSTGNPERLLCVSRDITAHQAVQEELERARAKAEFEAKHDSLTGLLNRPAFREHLQRQLGHTSMESPTAVLFLDLDEFKSINDALGHPAGDQLLRETAKRLAACLRGSDLIARFGGDEFAILQSSIEDIERAESLAQRIISCLREPYHLEGRQVVVGASVGVAVADAADLDADSLLKRADIALYQAKRAGKGVVCSFELGMDEAADEHQRLRSELREAVARGEFRLHYQPVVEFETSRVVSFEALVRWQHPRRGLLSPADFITLAEETGFIVEIGDWVLREACRQAVTWLEGISVSVNLSPRQFKANCLSKAVSEALAATGLPASRLQLEITESVLLEDDVVVRKTIEKLRALGVRISIDDFGTGYSSLGYLRRFAVDNIKIDRSFVADLVENPRSAGILRTMAFMARALRVSLTAEGIETVDHMQKLKAMGCRQGQGYFFSRPIPSEQVAAFAFVGPANTAGEMKRPCSHSGARLAH